MRPPAVESCFEAAFWYLDRALNDGEYLQPQKLQRMIYLAQAYHGVLQNGAKLMPGTFVAMPEGPIEPTLYRAFSRGRPLVDLSPVDETVKHILDSVWRQFGAHSVDYLNKMIVRHPPYADAFAAGPGTEIDYEHMVEFYGTQGLGRRKPSAAASDAPSADKVLRPKVMRSHTGKPVSAVRWRPSKKV